VEDTQQICFTPSGRKYRGEIGDTLLQVAQDAGVAVRSLCGGYGQCHQCWIEISEGKHSKFKVDCKAENVSGITSIERQLIADNPRYKGKRLACQTCIQGDLVIDVPEESQEHKAYISKKNPKQDYSVSSAISLFDCELEESTLDENPSATENLLEQLDKQGIKARVDFSLLRGLQPLIHESKGNLTVAVRDKNEVVAVYPQGEQKIIGAAIDIGSTTLALYVYDLKNGSLVYESSAMNPQIRYGEDLMSRVSYVMMNKGGDKKLTVAVRTKITEMLHEACEVLELQRDKLLEVVLVGNPIMHHIFFGISPVELGQAPFTVATRNWLDVDAQDLGFDLYPKTRISFLPLIAGHVGADAAAAYLSQMHIMHSKTALLVDIGTNAEIVLAKEGRVYATSSPTGPAFEGAEISSGVRATYGAIERVRIDKDTLNALMKLNQQLLRLNRNLLVCCVISALISAFVAQMLAEEESYLNTTITILVGYAVFFGFFGCLFYLDNKKRYQAMRPKLIKKELIKLASSFGIGEIVYIGIRWALMFYFLEIELEPFAASLVSEAIATLFYIAVVSAVIKATKVY